MENNFSKYENRVISADNTVSKRENKKAIAFKIISILILLCRLIVTFNTQI